MAVVSLLDTDFYKYTMMQVAWKRYRDAQVKFEFFQRDTGQAAPVGAYLDNHALNEEFRRIRWLRLEREELQFLWDTGLFEKDFIEALKMIDLPKIECYIDNDGTLKISTKGAWWQTTLWETIILSTVNEQYNTAMLKNRSSTNLVKARADGLYRLQEKAKTIRNWAPTAAITDFGTRRRFSHEWQGFALEILKREMPENLVGTSNVYWAKELGLKPVGTYAHEMDMVYAGLYCPLTTRELQLAHKYMMNDWEAQYGYQNRIGLTDTWGSDFFFRNFSKEQSIQWAGVRHDSGDPFKFIERVITHYSLLGIDPTQKTIIFSDGLDYQTIIKIHEKCFGRIRHGFGWGTDLMNDCGNLPLSLVVKATEVNGDALVKLSDNLNKAIGDPSTVASYMKMAAYKEQQRKELNS